MTGPFPNKELMRASEQLNRSHTGTFQEIFIIFYQSNLFILS